MITDIGLKKAVILTAEILTLEALSYPFCVENMSYDWLMLWITVGIFFEAARMRLWIIFGTPDTDSSAVQQCGFCLLTGQPAVGGGMEISRGGIIYCRKYSIRCLRTAVKQLNGKICTEGGRRLNPCLKRPGI